MWCVHVKTLQKFHKSSEKRERVLSKITENSEDPFYNVSSYIYVNIFIIQHICEYYDDAINKIKLFILTNLSF